MKLKIQKWGNSAAIKLPATMLSQIGASIGDKVEVEPKALRLTRPRYKLEDLLKECDITAPMPTDIENWEKMEPIGLEIVDDIDRS